MIYDFSWLLGWQSGCSSADLAWVESSGYLIAHLGLDGPRRPPQHGWIQSQLLDGLPHSAFHMGSHFEWGESGFFCTVAAGFQNEKVKASYVLGSEISTPSLSTDKSKIQGQPRFGDRVGMCVKKLMLTLQTGMDTRVGWFTRTILIPVTTMRNWFVGTLSLRYLIDIWVEMLSRLLDTWVWSRGEGFRESIYLGIIL